jgi:hypothetical protein
VISLVLCLRSPIFLACALSDFLSPDARRVLISLRQRVVPTSVASPGFLGCAHNLFFLFSARSRSTAGLLSGSRVLHGVSCVRAGISWIPACSLQLPPVRLRLQFSPLVSKSHTGRWCCQLRSFESHSVFIVVCSMCSKHWSFRSLVLLLKLASFLFAAPRAGGPSYFLRTGQCLFSLQLCSKTHVECKLLSSQAQHQTSSN